MSILDLLRSKEVRASLLALDMEIEAAESLAEGLFLSSGFYLAAPAVRAAIRNAPDKVKSKINEEHMSPKTLVYMMLVNQCGMLIDSHQYHNAFGGLLMQGDGLVALWLRGAAELESAGVWSAEEAKQNRAVFRQQCET